jgi:hypothetical protein
MSQNFTADHVWALAVIADRMNGGYNKNPVGHWDNETDKWVEDKPANKTMVKQWLRDESMVPTAEDIKQGQECRSYFKSFVMKELSGKINDFERTALKVSAKDHFGGRDMLEFAIISCLPQAMRKDQERNDIQREIFGSTQLAGQVGDKIHAEVTVVKSHYSQNYDKYRVTAQLGDSYIDFWFAQECQAGEKITIKGKIKTQRADKTTQLNYVKKM